MWSGIHYANLVEAADEWSWSSIWHRVHGSPEKLLGEGPLALPRRWRQHVQSPETEAELAALRRSVVRDSPFGGIAWQERTAKRLHLQTTLHPRGRPAKTPKSES
jgi:putative transposase